MRCFCPQWNHLRGCPDRNSKFRKISATQSYTHGKALLCEICKRRDCAFLEPPSLRRVGCLSHAGYSLPGGPQNAFAIVSHSMERRRDGTGDPAHRIKIELAGLEFKRELKFSVHIQLPSVDLDKDLEPGVMRDGRCPSASPQCKPGFSAVGGCPARCGSPPCLMADASGAEFRQQGQRRFWC